MKGEEIVVLLLAFVTGFVFSRMMRSNVVERSGGDGQAVTFYNNLSGGLCGDTTRINSYLNNLENVSTPDDLHNNALTGTQLAVLEGLCNQHSNNEIICSFDRDRGCYASEVTDPH
jgi:hypothetical protein